MCLGICYGIGSLDAFCDCKSLIVNSLLNISIEPRIPFGTRGSSTLAMSYSRTTFRCTTIGAAAFHFRVRNGNGWDHRARITRRLEKLKVSFRAHFPSPENLATGRNEFRLVLPFGGGRHEERPYRTLKEHRFFDTCI